MAIHLIEISPTLQKIQKGKLKESNIHWHVDINDLPEQPTIFLANEFFDALPIDQFMYHNGEWYENRITRRDDGVLFQCLILESRKEKSYVSLLTTQMPDEELF